MFIPNELVFYPRGARDVRILAVIVCQSVRVSVCMSVCYTPVLYQTAKRRITRDTESR